VANIPQIPVNHIRVVSKAVINNQTWRRLISTQRQPWNLATGLTQHI